MTALRWSSDFIVGEYRDVQAKIITLDYTGRYLLLPSRRQLAIKDLTEPIDDIILLPRNGKAEVVDAAWNPHFHYKELCALCAGTSVEILSWYKECDLRRIKLLRSHTRAVTGVDWHPIDPNLFASSSLDAYAYVWDMRDYQRPVMSFSSFAGATNIKWNKLSRHVLATTHCGDIKIWDERKNTAPIQYITAYISNVFGVDWNPTKQNQIAAANQDGNVKIYDIIEPQKTRTFIEAGAPVWKVSYCPFGGGNSILGVMVPETRKSETSLLLWHLSKTNVPLHTFVGQTEIVLDIEWRVSKQDESEYQLITWDKDQTLRIWEVDKHLLQLSGQETITLDASNTHIIASESISTPTTTPTASPPNEVIVDREAYDTFVLNDINSIRRETASIVTSSAIPIRNNKSPSPDDNYRNNRRESIITATTVPVIVSPVDEVDKVTTAALPAVDLTPANLSQELARDLTIPNVQFDKVDVMRRLCSVTIKHDTDTIVLLINFPPSYPRNRCPVFRFMKGTTIDNSIKTNILKVLKETAEQKVRSNEVCLEACLIQLVATLNQTSNDDEEKSSTDKPADDDNKSTSDEKQETYVLPPRTCGAKFCHIGMLVCFMKPKSILIEKNGVGSLTLKRYLQKSNTAGPISARRRYVISQGLLRKIKISSRMHTKMIAIYDVSAIFLVNKILAEKYTFIGTNMASVCKKNAQIAATIGRKDLVNMWNLVALAASPPSSETTQYYVDWNKHPFAREMIESMINYYSSVHDIQTAAMLACIFCHRKWATNENESKTRKTITAALPNNFPYHTVHPTESSSSLSLETSWSHGAARRHRSNSWSDYYDDIIPITPIEHPTEIIIDAKPKPPIQEKAIKHNEFYETVKILYAELLNRWRLLIPRTLVMKCIVTPTEAHRGVEFVVECGHCQNAVTDKVCPNCKIPSLVCIICRLSVKGSANFCLACGHGGHTIHMKNWFKTERTCPSGCKCKCLFETNLFFHRESIPQSLSADE